MKFFNSYNMVAFKPNIEEIFEFKNYRMEYLSKIQYKFDASNAATSPALALLFRDFYSRQGRHITIQGKKDR